MDRPDPTERLAAVRQERRARPAHRDRSEAPTIAVVADTPDDALVTALSASGWRVTGLLLADVFDGLLWAARTEGVGRNYVELPELLLDAAVDAACIASPEPAGAPVLAALLHAGLHALLPAPADLTTDSVRRALDAADEGEAEHAVAFAMRWTAPAMTVAALVADGATGPIAQVTARGWPTGGAATAELVDLVTGWCGAVVAVCASPADLPASELPGGAPVRWALLTEQGTTVLVAHEGADEPTLRLSCGAGRLRMTAGSLAWAGGEEVPLSDAGLWPPPAPVPGLSLRVADAPPAASRGLLVTAHRLALVAQIGDGALLDGGRSGYSSEVPAVASLRDLFVVARVREALRRSAGEGGWTETG